MTDPRCRSVHLDAGGTSLHGELTVPDQPRGLVVFVTGTSAATHATLETALHRPLHRFGIATLVMDLVAPSESASRANRPDIGLLLDRTRLWFDWIDDQPTISDLDTVLCGIDTGAAAAIDYIDSHGRPLSAVALINGRVDLAETDRFGTDIPLLVFVEEARSHLVDANRAVYRDADIPPQRRHFLHAVNEDALSIAARWMYSQLTTGASDLQSPSVRTERQGI